MNFFEKIMMFLTSEIDSAPKSYGAFHLIMLAVIVSAAVILNAKFHSVSDRRFRKILAILWCVMVVGEIYHQSCFFFGVENGVASWEYQWYKFPFQFCATPLYILPLAIFPRNERVRGLAEAFLMSFSLFAGLAVIIYPNDVFVSLIGASVQSMIHHGLQVVIGIFIGIRNRKRLTFKFFLGGALIFAILLVLAVIINEIGFHLLRGAGLDDTFNMFYLSPYFSCTLPVLCDLYPILPYPLFFAVYLFGFCAIAAIVFYIIKGLSALITHIKNTNFIESSKGKYAKI